MINQFPGYSYENGKNMFRGEDVGRGGYVYAVPGIYNNVVCFDSASHHPSSIIAMNLFGKHTERYKEILEARIAIKHRDYEALNTLLGGSLRGVVQSDRDAKEISGALKIVLNSMYGLTSASFPNPCRDPRNVNNIVALRGALFMVVLRDALIERGETVIHIKTDSIKVVNPSEGTFEFINNLAKDYGYTFEIEHIFKRFCLVNNAVYIAYRDEKDSKGSGWEATGAQFAQPYVFKTLFSKEPIDHSDFQEAKSVSVGAIYLDFNEKLAEDDHEYKFVGRTGLFTPVISGVGGARLVRLNQRTKKYDYVTGSSGYRWMESEMVNAMDLWDKVDISYYNNLADKAIATIEKYGDFERFRSIDDEDIHPFCPALKDCEQCQYYEECDPLPF